MLPGQMLYLRLFVITRMLDSQCPFCFWFTKNHAEMVEKISSQKVLFTYLLWICTKTDFLGDA